MFKAVRYGKLRGLDGEKIEGKVVQWSAVYQGAEDFETAAIFTRLFYLPTSEAWSILRRAFHHFSAPSPLPAAAGELISVEFWPKIPFPGNDRTYVEPDVVATFEELTVIVEVKRGDSGNMQTAEQLSDEWRATLNERKLDPLRTFLMALGGINRCHHEELSRVILREIHDAKLYGCTWRHLSSVLHQFVVPVDAPHKRILADLIEILDYHGHKDFLYAESFSKLVARAALHFQVDPGLPCLFLK